jgi:hypothetical protein
MIRLLCFVLAVLISPKARLRLEAENASLRHQLIAINAEMMKSKDKQISLSDSDARSGRQVARTPASLATTCRLRLIRSIILSWPTM